MNDEGLDGAERVGRPPARRRSSQAVRWTVAMRAAFFAQLAGSCNITAAAATIGLMPTQVYQRRRVDVAFGTDWDDAIAIAYQVLETRMLGHVLAGGGETLGAVAGLAPEPVAWEQAIKLLGIHRARREGRAVARDPSQAVATRAQTDAAIVSRLNALAARKQRAAAAGLATGNGGADA